MTLAIDLGRLTYNIIFYNSINLELVYLALLNILINENLNNMYQVLTIDCIHMYTVYGQYIQHTVQNFLTFN